MREDPIAFAKHIAETMGLKILPDQENLMQRYFRGEPLETLLPDVRNPLLVKPERQVVDLDLDPKAGWTLANLFTHYVAEKHSFCDGQGEHFNASHVHYRVHTARHSFHDVIDFQWRLENLAQLPGAPGIELAYERPELLSDERLTSDVMRVLRTIDNDKKYIEEGTGSLLSTSCIVDVIRQLYLHLQEQKKKAT